VLVAAEDLVGVPVSLDCPPDRAPRVGSSREVILAVVPAEVELRTPGRSSATQIPEIAVRAATIPIAPA